MITFYLVSNRCYGIFASDDEGEENEEGEPAFTVFSIHGFIYIFPLNPRIHTYEVHVRMGVIM